MKAKPQPETPAFKWELIDSDGLNNATYRAEVPGGWLYRHYTHTNASMVFVPDPDYDSRRNAKET